ncbi:MAG: hypothetical protein ABL957_17170, partial [Parvularculaceae bacterium]
SYEFNNLGDAGAWKVKVNNPDGKSSDLFSFTVTAAPTTAPSISGLSPGSYPASSSNQTMKVNGASFVSGATLTFTTPGGTTIASSASKLTFVSSGQISYEFNNLGDAGAWKVKVNNPDGKSSDLFSFTVR